MQPIGPEAMATAVVVQCLRFCKDQSVMHFLGLIKQKKRHILKSINWSSLNHWNIQPPSDIMRNCKCQSILLRCCSSWETLSMCTLPCLHHSRLLVYYTGKMLETLRLANDKQWHSSLEIRSNPVSQLNSDQGINSKMVQTLSN